MRIKIELINNNKISLPMSYNAFLQAFVYSLLEPHAASWLHEKGYENQEKSFRLFTFSEILEKGKLENKLFVFPLKISFYVSSPVDWILEQVAHNAIRSSSLRLGNNSVDISSVSIMAPPKINSSQITVKAVTPIEVHATFDTSDNKQKTYYFTPFESDFKSRINNNLANKWVAFKNHECPYTINIEPLFKGDKYKRVRSFIKDRQRPFRVNGWLGQYRLTGDPEFLTFAYDAGLGSGNSRGFGMFDVV